MSIDKAVPSDVDLCRGHLAQHEIEAIYYEADLSGPSHVDTDLVASHPKPGMAH